MGLSDLICRKRPWTKRGSSSKTSCHCPSSTRKRKSWASPLSSTGETANRLMNMMSRSLRSGFWMLVKLHPESFYYFTSYLFLLSLLLLLFASGSDPVPRVVMAELWHLRQNEPPRVQKRHRSRDAHVPDKVHPRWASVHFGQSQHDVCPQKIHFIFMRL